MITEVHYYKASDGTSFENKEDALIHEWNSCHTDWDIMIYDERGDVISHPWENCFDDIWYIHINTNEGLEALEVLSDMLEVSVENFPTEIGFYKYDEAIEGWIAPKYFIERALDEWRTKVDWIDVIKEIIK